AIENMMGTVGRVSRKREALAQRGDGAALDAAGIVEATKGFRQLKAHCRCSEPHLQLNNPSPSPNQLNATLMPHSPTRATPASLTSTKSGASRAISRYRKACKSYLG